MLSSKVPAVHLQAVSYRYPQSDKVALSEIFYTFPTGTTAIVGPNGAGKSTLVKLLTGLLAPTSGSISVQLPCGACVPPEQGEKAALFQEPSHLYLTIRQNVTMRFERTPNEDARIHKALEIAGLSGVVEGLPDGIDTLVGAGFGGRLDLSGGQWQRLALARLIYQDAPVMILDEPVASLDPEGERAVFELFAQFTQAKVIVFTTHRYDSIPRGTKIVVLIDGRVTEIGTHEELLQREGHYRSLYIAGGPAARNATDLDAGRAGRHQKRGSQRQTFAAKAGIRPNGSTMPRVEWLLTTQEPGRKVRSSPDGNMYADAVAKIADSIFPIFFIQPQGNRLNVGVSGTGCFVDSSGLFLTADHVITRAPIGSTMYYYGKVPDEVCEPAIEIEHVASDPAQDLYLGRVSRDYLQPVEFSNEPARPGNSVCLSGYPMAVLAISPQGRLVGNVRRYWQPTFVIDDAQAVIDNRTYDGYIVQHSCLAGMSGGPVFDMEGKVRGIAVATLTRTIPEPGGNPTVVPNGIVIDVQHIRAFLEANASDRRFGDPDRIHPEPSAPGSANGSYRATTRSAASGRVCRKY